MRGLIALLSTLLAAATLAQPPIAEAQREAIRLFPELGVAGSQLNRAFVAEVGRLSKEEPAALTAPDWPLTLARRLAAGSTGGVAPVEMDPAWRIPKMHSLRSEFDKLGLVVKDQGRRGSCAVFGALGVVEYYLAKRGQRVQLSEQFAAWAANESAHDLGNRSGYNEYEIIDGIRKFGITTEELMPYRTNRVGRPSKEALADAATRKNVGVTFFQERADRDGFANDVLRAICGAISEGSPVTVHTAWPGNDKLDQTGTLVDRGASPNRPGHVIVAVGYTRDARLPGGGAFVYRQSWGAGYGDNGYAKVTFDYLAKHGRCAYAVRLF